MFLIGWSAKYKVTRALSLMSGTFCAKLLRKGRARTWAATQDPPQRVVRYLPTSTAHLSEPHAGEALVKARSWQSAKAPPTSHWPILRLCHTTHLHHTQQWQVPFFQPSTLCALGMHTVPKHCYLAARVLETPTLPSRDFQAHLRARTFESFYQSTVTSASLSTAEAPRLFTRYGETCGGVLLSFPPNNVLAAAPHDLNTPQPLDFFISDTNLLKPLRGPLPSPETVLISSHNTQEPWNEIWLAPVLKMGTNSFSAVTQEAIFIYTRALDLNAPGPAHEPFIQLAETYDLPLLQLWVV